MMLSIPTPSIIRQIGRLTLMTNRSRSQNEGERGGNVVPRTVNERCAVMYHINITLDNKIKRGVNISVDITERREAQRRVRIAPKKRTWFSTLLVLYCSLTMISNRYRILSFD